MQQGSGPGPPAFPAGFVHNTYTQNLLIIHRKARGPQEGYAGSTGLGLGFSPGSAVFLRGLGHFPSLPGAFGFSPVMEAQGGGEEDGEAPAQAGDCHSSHIGLGCCLRSTSAFFLGREAMSTQYLKGVAHGQAGRGAVVSSGGREGALVTCAPLLCAGPVLQALCQGHFTRAAALCGNWCSHPSEEETEAWDLPGLACTARVASQDGDPGLAHS